MAELAPPAEIVPAEIAVDDQVLKDRMTEYAGVWFCNLEVAEKRSIFVAWFSRLTQAEQHSLLEELRGPRNNIVPLPPNTTAQPIIADEEPENAEPDPEEQHVADIIFGKQKAS